MLAVNVSWWQVFHLTAVKPPFGFNVDIYLVFVQLYCYISLHTQRWAKCFLRLITFLLTHYIR